MGREDADITESVLFEDDWLIAVDKPAGVIVHGDGTGSRTMLDEVRELLARRDGLSAEQAIEVQPIQRLDRDTTGIVLFSKQKEMQPAFDRLVAERRIEKRYLAVVHGDFPTGKQELRAPIGRDRHDARRMRVSRTGKSAWTTARLIAQRANGRGAGALSLVGIELHTGRKHQIRVHLSHAGFPIVGDGLYSRTSARDRGRALMLHAFEEAFTHPLTGERVVIRSPYPARFAALFPEETLERRR